MFVRYVAQTCRPSPVSIHHSPPAFSLRLEVYRLFGPLSVPAYPRASEQETRPDTRYLSCAFFGGRCGGSAGGKHIAQNVVYVRVLARVGLSSLLR